MKHIIALLLTIGFLSGCAKNDSSGGSEANVQKPPEKMADPEPQTEREVLKKRFQESYQLNLNGCDTGKHSFGSDVSADEVKKQLCDALQDDKVNGSCAEPLRHELFDKKCSGSTWSPKYAPVVVPNTPPRAHPDNSVNYLTQENVKTALKYLLVDKYEVSTSLSAEEKQSVIKFAEDLMSCGLSYLGPKCLEYQTTAGYYSATLGQVDEKYVFYSELRIKGVPALVALTFKIEQIQPNVKITAVEISKVLKPRNGQSIDQYLKDNSAFGVILNLTLSPSFQTAATKRLQSPRDIRELFHVSKMLLESSNYSQAAINTVADSLAKMKSLIVGSTDIRYQEEMLSLISSQIEIKKDVLVDICSGLVNSKSENLRQVAATIVLDARPSRTDLKPLVLKALNNSRWDIRIKAISAISKVQKTTAEENLLLAKIGDGDSDVRKVAITAGSKIAVNNSHLSVAKELGTNQHWDVRIEAAKILSRINSAESTQALIGLMNDQDSDVRRQVADLLQKRSLGEASVTDLANQMKSQKWDVRRDAALSLSKIGSDQALLTLIGKMDDQDSDVRAVIVKELLSKQVKDGFINALTENYKSKHWDVRRDVSILLAKNSSFAATTALISQMNDQDGDVRAIIYEKLASRRMTNEFVPNLKKHFSSQHWDVRRDVARLLAKIKSPESLSALKDQLSKESDGDVKTQIIASINIVKN